MKKILVLFFSALSVCRIEAVETVAPTQQINSTVQTYTNKDHGYSFQYPGNWTKKDDIKGIDVIVMAPEDSDGRSLANFSVISEKVNSDTMADYVKKNVQDLLKEDPHTKISDQGILQVGGKQAAWIKYTKGDVQAQITQYFMISNGYGIIMTSAVAGEAASKYSSALDTIVKSFKLQ